MIELQWFCYCSRVCDLLGFRRRKPNEEEKENPKKGSNCNLIRFEFRFAFAVVCFLFCRRSSFCLSMEKTRSGTGRMEVFSSHLFMGCCFDGGKFYL